LQRLPRREAATRLKRHSGLRLYDQFFQGIYVSAVITRFIDGRFRDERGVRQAEVVQQPLKRVPSNHSFSNMLMPVEL
jgi:hypothetical protein